MFFQRQSQRQSHDVSYVKNLLAPAKVPTDGNLRSGFFDRQTTPADQSSTRKQEGRWTIYANVKSYMAPDPKVVVRIPSDFARKVVEGVEAAAPIADEDIPF